MPHIWSMLCTVNFAWFQLHVLFQHAGITQCCHQAARLHQAVRLLNSRKIACTLILFRPKNTQHAGITQCCPQAVRLHQAARLLNSQTLPAPSYCSARKIPHLYICGITVWSPLDIVAKLLCCGQHVEQALRCGGILKLRHQRSSFVEWGKAPKYICLH